MQDTKKGQLTFTNLIGVLVSCIIYLIVFLPVYQPIANQTIAGLDITWQFYTITVILIQVLPLIVICALVLGILNYSQPQYG